MAIDGLLPSFLCEKTVAKIVNNTSRHNKTINGYKTQLVSGYKSSGLNLISTTTKGVFNVFNT